MQPHRRILARCRTRGRLSGSMRRCSCSRSTTHRRATPTPSISSRHCRAPLGNATDRRANASIVVFVCCGAGGALPDTLWCVVLLRAPDSLPHMVRDIERVRLLHRCRIRNCCRRCTATTRTAGTTSCSSTWTQVRAARPIDPQQRQGLRGYSLSSAFLPRPNAIAPVAQRNAYTAVWHRSVRTQA